jgi:UTP--glucose-1-phosphate uridylyltransferase
MSVLDEVDAATRAVLERYGFDADRFEALRGRVARGELTPESNVVRGAVEPPTADDVDRLPGPGEPGHAEAHGAGVEALRAGRVAQVVLAGGMATRFGGVVKGVVEVIHGRSFLDVKLAETARLADEIGATVPVALMTSFATDAVTREHVGRLEVPEPDYFPQFVSLRLEPSGALFRDGAGAVSLHGPGHGDLFDALRLSGLLERLRAQGVEHVAVSNVDNLGARIDPAVVGAHLLAGTPLTIEVAAKDGDAGGAPARVAGRLRVVEGPCFPPGFDQGSIPVFSTNTATVALEAIAGPVELSWMYVSKQVDGRPAVQLERLYHELSALVPTTCLEVPRGGARGRFMPVKTPEDLPRVRADLEAMLGTSLA